MSETKQEIEQILKQAVTPHPRYQVAEQYTDGPIWTKEGKE